MEILKKTKQAVIHGKTTQSDEPQDQGAIDRATLFDLTQARGCSLPDALDILNQQKGAQIVYNRQMGDILSESLNDMGATPVKNLIKQLKEVDKRVAESLLRKQRES